MGFFDEDGNIRPEIVRSLKTVPQGAATSVWCVTSPLLDDIGGVYCEDADIAELDPGKLGEGSGFGARGVQEYSLDEGDAKKLWALSEQMTGVKFNVE